MKDEKAFFRFFGRLVFEDADCDWRNLSAGEREHFCKIADDAMLGPLLVYRLGEALPEQYFRKFREAYQSESFTGLRERGELAQFYRLLEAAKIPVVPIKGVDLSFRVFPERALRGHGDWDMLFRASDCDAVFRLLAENGWHTGNGGIPGKAFHFHYEPLVRNQQMLEVHRSLPHFGNAGLEEIQSETQKVSEYRRVLTPEMNLVLIAAHARGSQQYTHLSPWRILLDAGFILKHDAVDWQKVHRLADRWEILRPDILFSAWSEFFPAGMLPAESFDTATGELIRSIFAQREMVREASPLECGAAHWMVVKNKRNGRNFQFPDPAYIRKKYHLKANQRWRLKYYAVREALVLLGALLKKFRRVNRGLLNYYRQVAELEKRIRHPE